MAAYLVGVTLSAATPMSPAPWALLEREPLRANATACKDFFQRYFDERGYLQCVEHWGDDDGPDDAIESDRAPGQLYSLIPLPVWSIPRGWGVVSVTIFQLSPISRMAVKSRAG